jgi:hypothetical protein
VRTEATFKTALYLAQLTESGPARGEVYERAHDSYRLRSDITHGSQRGVSIDQWKQAWGLFMDAYNAVIRRGSLPSETDLIAELLS